MKTFHSISKNKLGEHLENEKNCLKNIKSKVSEKTGVTEFIDCDDFSVVFAGTKDEPQLLCEVCTMKGSNETYLHISVEDFDDEASWAENDYDSEDDFESAVAEYIANRMGKTVKTVVKADKSEYRVSSYYRDENDEWVCFEDDSTDEKLITRIAAKLVKTGETVKTYTLPNSEK